MFSYKTNKKCTPLFIVPNPIYVNKRSCLNGVKRGPFYNAWMLICQPLQTWSSVRRNTGCRKGILK